MNREILCIFFLTSMLFAPSLTDIHAVKAQTTYSRDCIRFYAFTLYSPLNRTYNSQSLTIDLSFGAAMGIRYSLYYYLDGIYQDTIPYKVWNTNETHVVYQATASTRLPTLPIGSHSLTIFFIAAGLFRPLPSNNETVYFNIDLNAPSNSPSPNILDTTPPTIKDISLDNKTYSSTDIPLSFIISENVSRIDYSLDNADNVTIAGNVTLNGLMIGIHNVTIYCWDKAGNIGTSKTLNFHVDDTASGVFEQSEFLSPAMIIAISLIVIVVFVVASVYWKKKAALS